MLDSEYILSNSCQNLLMAWMPGMTEGKKSSQEDSEVCKFKVSRLIQYKFAAKPPVVKIQGLTQQPKKGLRFIISHKLPGPTGDAGPWNTFCSLLKDSMHLNGNSLDSGARIYWFTSQ